VLVGYLLTSAHGLFEEPEGHGAFRLVDAAGRLLAIMEAQGLTDPYLDELKDAVDVERTGVSSDEELRERLDEPCVQYAVELKARI
jgi:hypothetical protein